MVYDSIHSLTIYKWDKFLETNDYSYLTDSLFKCEPMPDVVEKINNEIIDEFGVSENIKQKLDLQRQILFYKLSILKGNETDVIRLNDAKNELTQLIEKELEAAQKLGEKAAVLHTRYNIRINVSEMTIYEFYHLLSVYNKEKKSK